MKKMKRIISSLCMVLLIFTMFSSINISATLPNSNPGGTLNEFPSEIPTLAEKSKPVLQILSTETHRVYSQKENTIKFLLSNTSRFTANGVKIKPDVSADKSVEGVRIVSHILNPNNYNISPDSSREYELKLVVDDTAKEGTYPIYLNITYKNNAGDPYELTLIIYYEVRKDATKLEKIEITEDNFSELFPEADKDITFQYKIRNDENYMIRNVKTRIEGLPEAFTLKSASNTATIGDIMPVIAKPASFTYYVNSNITAGSYPFTVVYEYDNQDGRKIVRQEKYNIFISNAQTGNGSGKIAYTGFSYPRSVAQDAPFNISFQITNNGEKDINDLTVKLADNSVFLPKTPSIIKYDELKKGKTKNYSITVVGTGDSLKDRNYPINFEISYKTGTSKDAPVIVDNQIIGVYINAKDGNGEDGNDKNLPKIILDSYQLEPNIVQAGHEFELDMVFRNTNRVKDIYNVKAFLTFDVATGKETVNQNVFSPVNSSNTFYINHIAPNGRINQKLRMSVVPDAEPKTYTVTVNFEYEDKDGKQISSKELVGIPVMQTTKVETSELTLPTSVGVDQEFSASFNIYNTGKAKVYNLMINTEGDFKADPNNQYIGNFDVGQSNSYEGYIRFTEPGEKSGKFILSYDDQNGKKYTVEKEFTINVEEPIMPDQDFNDLPGDDMGQEPIPTGQSTPLWMIIGGILLLIIIIVIIIRIIRRRKHKKEMSSYEED